MAMSERRREYLEAVRARRRERAAQQPPVTPEQEQRALADWVLMGLPVPPDAVMLPR